MRDDNRYFHPSDNPQQHQITSGQTPSRFPNEEQLRWYLTLAGIVVGILLGGTKGFSADGIGGMMKGGIGGGIVGAIVGYISIPVIGWLITLGLFYAFIAVVALAIGAIGYFISLFK